MPKQNPLLISLLAALLWAPPGLSAQDAAPVELERIVITGTRSETPLGEVARSISVVDAQAIQRGTQQLGLDEALAGVPGLYMQNRDNFAQDLRLSLRGFGARSNFGIRGVKILVDGIPETLPDGQGGVDSIDLGSAQRIEVLRGPSSSLYGNAAGGVLAISSELGSARPYVEARAATGGEGYRQLQLKSAGAAVGVDYLFNLSQTRLDGYREHAALRGRVASARLGLNLSTVDRLIVSLNLTDQPEAQDPGGINAAQAAANPRAARDRNLQFDAGEALEQQRLGAIYQHRAATGTLTLRNHLVWRDFSNRLPFEAGGAVVLDRLFWGGGIQFDFAELPPALNVSLGADFDRQDDERQRFDNLDGRRGPKVFDQHEQVDSIGLFAQARLALSSAWSVQAGLRYDEIRYAVEDRQRNDGDDSGRLDFDAVSPALSISYRRNAGLVFVTYSSSFETPTTTELANPDASGGFNPGLRPQTAEHFELGYKYAQARFYAELALFAIELDDELVPFELEAFPGRSFYANAGGSSRWGLEAALNWRFGEKFKLEAAYTWSDFKFDRFVDGDGNDFAGKQQPGLPAHFGFLGLSWEAGSGAYARLETAYSGTLFADNANTVQIDSYAVTRLRLGHEFSRDGWRFAPYLGISNLFNARYHSNVRINAFGGRYFEPAASRSVYAGLVVRLE